MSGMEPAMVIGGIASMFNAHQSYRSQKKQAYAALAAEERKRALEKKRIEKETKRRQSTLRARMGARGASVSSSADAILANLSKVAEEQQGEQDWLLSQFRKTTRQRLQRQRTDLLNSIL